MDSNNNTMNTETSFTQPLNQQPGNPMSGMAPQPNQNPGGYPSLQEQYNPPQQYQAQPNVQGFNQPPPQNLGQQQGFPPQMNQQQQGYPQQMNQQPMMNNNMPPMQNPNQQQPPMVNQQPPNLLDKLMAMGGIYVKQKINLVEDITGCVQQNRYEVFSADDQGKQNSTMAFMTVKEDSSCIQRQCLPSQCRETGLNMTMNVENIPGSGQWTDKLVVRTKKDCSCTFFCLNRPETEVYLQTPGGEQNLGTIRNPFYCCQLGIETHKGKGLHNTIKASCCQLGVLCPCPCRPCQEVDFDVYNSQGYQMLPLKKQSAGFLRACLGTNDADFFSVIFPKDYSKEDRMLLIAATIFLDYMYFNETPEKPEERVNKF